MSWHYSIEALAVAPALSTRNRTFFRVSTAGVDRPWALLPEQSQPLRPQSGDAAAFPSHQQAIDTYYRLLFEHESARRRKEEVSQP